MKKLISLLLITAVLISGCEKASEEPPIESSSESSSLSESIEALESSDISKEESVPLTQNESFYPAKCIRGEDSLDYANRAPFKWNADGSFTFQNENTLVTLSEYNEVINTVTLPLEYLPAEKYSLSWSDKYIVAFSAAEQDAQLNFTSFFETEDGKVHLTNATVFDSKGNPVTRYRLTEVYGQSGNYTLPTYKNDGLTFVSSALSANNITWLNDTSFIVNCNSNIIIFDVEAERGRMLFDEKEEIFASYFDNEEHEGVTGGYYYTLGNSQNGRSSVFMFDEKGYKLPNGEKEANILEVGDGFVMAADTAEDYSEIISWAKAGETNFEVIAEDARGWPQTFGKYIWWQTMYKYGPMENAFYVFNTETGETSCYKSGYSGYQLLHKVVPSSEGFKFYYEENDPDGTSGFWVYDSVTETKTELDYNLMSKVLYIYDDYVSPTGKTYVEYDDYNEFTNLRIARFE